MSAAVRSKLKWQDSKQTRIILWKTGWKNPTFDLIEIQHFYLWSSSKQWKCLQNEIDGGIDWKKKIHSAPNNILLWLV